LHYPNTDVLLRRDSFYNLREGKGEVMSYEL